MNITPEMLQFLFFILGLGIGMRPDTAVKERLRSELSAHKKYIEVLHSQRTEVLLDEWKSAVGGTHVDCKEVLGTPTLRVACALCGGAIVRFAKDFTKKEMAELAARKGWEANTCPECINPRRKK